MFTIRKPFTLLAIAALSATAFVVPSALADEASDDLTLYTDFLVKSSLNEVKESMALEVNYDVLTAAHKFEPENDESAPLLAEITITPITKPVNGNDNDA
ncbi:hypothetical protein GTH32_12935 [Alteromonas sp. 345S023]|uniref:Uncharacterized protein n=1 Tax=Alteromonas profundi TaxID=2696062 RepID=A0A7X5LME2_9ALTE|nr:hypothetical protein [Alteromonas profundi]NDV92078.1 hypothetical protein [Alteromonas profundi]